MSFRERIEWVFRMGLLVFILAAAAFLSAVTAMRFAVQGREVTMPNLVGKSSGRSASHPAGTRPAIESGRSCVQRFACQRCSAAKPAGRRAHEEFAECARGAQPGSAKCDHAFSGRRISARGTHSIAASGPAIGRSDCVLLARSVVRHNPAAVAEAGDPCWKSTRGSARGSRRHRRRRM